MKKTLLMLLTCCLVLGGSAFAASAADIISRISADELMEIVQQEGYAPSLARDSVISMKIEGFTTLLFIGPDNESIQAYASFRTSKATLELINEWNSGKRYSRAYLDEDGDPVLELDLDLAGGVTRERIIDFIRTVRASVPAFVRHFSDAN